MRSTWCSSPSRVSSCSTPEGTAPARPPPADGLTISDRAHVASSKGVQVLGDRDRRRIGGRLGLRARLLTPVSTIAASRPAAAAPARSESRRSPTTSVLPGASRSSAVRKICGAGLPTIAPAPGRVLERRDDGAGAGPASRRRSGRCGRARRRSSPRRPARPAWRRAARRMRTRHDRRRPRHSASVSPAVPLTIRWPASATWRKIAGEPIT